MVHPMQRWYPCTTNIGNEEVRLECGGKDIGSHRTLHISQCRLGQTNLAHLFLEMHSMIQVLSMMLQKSVDPDIRYHHEQTSLKMAAMHGKFDCVQILMQAGANVQIRGEECKINKISEWDNNESLTNLCWKYCASNNKSENCRAGAQVSQRKRRID
ncbi:hypothetical protein MKW98_023219 [Papaver atlanticum]|uniref:Uncharacterized protein n=1 Tax=Papaver atlanticum TaxID=357466 RepID=A0AAD4XVA7_9MAGN|nr:hypothetical protein MKW98_023219 [Papaver atlanticum]